MDVQTVAGRQFVGPKDDEISFEQYGKIAAGYQKAGLDGAVLHRVHRLIQKSAKDGAPDDDGIQALAGEVLVRIFDAGAHIDILAATLTPVGKAWSQEVYEETREFLRNLRGVAHFEKLQMMIVELVTAFFLSGLDSIKISQSSSIAMRHHGEDAFAIRGDEPQISESSTPSSANSQATIPPASPTS